MMQIDVVSRLTRSVVNRISRKYRSFRNVRYPSKVIPLPSVNVVPIVRTMGIIMNTVKNRMPGSINRYI